MPAKPKSFTFAATWLLLLAFLAAGAYFWFQAPELAWTAIDVNIAEQHAEAHLLQINRKTNILIDTGHPDTADRLIAFLREKEINQLNYVIITHSQRTHYGGLLPLLENDIAIDAVYMNFMPPRLVELDPGNADMGELENIKNVLRQKGVPLVALTKNAQWSFQNGISLRVLCLYNEDKPDFVATAPDDASAILMLTHKQNRFLFAGSATRKTGNYLLSQQDNTPLKADVLKMPHFGADEIPDDTFFAAVAPKALVVPAPLAIWLSPYCQRSRKMAEHIPTRVNGRDGHIIIKSNGTSFTMASQWLGTRTAAP